MIKKFFRKLKHHFLEVLKVRDSPRAIASGFAIGTAIAVLPTFGLGVFIGIGIVILFEKISKVSLFSSFLVWNPAILVFVYSLSFKIGDFILKDYPLKYFKLGYLNTFYLYSTKFLLGNIILVFTLTIISYFLVYYLAKRYQRQYKTLFVEPIKENLIEPIKENLIEPIKEGLGEIKETIKEDGSINS
jgi:uncharacterized protein